MKRYVILNKSTLKPAGNTFVVLGNTPMHAVSVWYRFNWFQSNVIAIPME